MAKRKSDNPEIVEVQEVQNVKTPSVPIWESNPQLVTYVLGGIALLVAGWLLYKKLIVAPKEKEAVAAMWQAELLFGRDSFQMALENPGGGFEGFASLADQYSGTKAGNACNYYAAICNLQMGNFDEAINYMNNYDGSGEVLPAIKYGVLGDCYSEKQDFAKAIDFYGKAADAAKIDLVAIYYLKKLGMLNEHEGNKDAAMKAYERIKRDFPNQQLNDWRDVEKYMYRANPEL
ncbi:MAG: tetratricopeptide repeat protein [Saprospiraceae bacterium]|nr:tetratricopeptide repeat protein [Saprospiraceae bacterium]MCB9342136.1 tetratricopeptide repeat protein [Lewinellaceae bacterium]